MKKGRSFILFCQSFSYQPETGKNFRLLHPAEKKAAGFLTHFKLINMGKVSFYPLIPLMIYDVKMAK